MEIRFKGVFIGWISEGNFEFFFQPILRPFQRICFFKINSILPEEKLNGFDREGFQIYYCFNIGQNYSFRGKIFT